MFREFQIFQLRDNRTAPIETHDVARHIGCHFLNQIQGLMPSVRCDKGPDHTRQQAVNDLLAIGQRDQLVLICLFDEANCL